MSINKSKEIEEKFENDNNMFIEYPKNYNDIVNFKLKRLEKEYQETINKNFSKEDLENNEDFDSDSEEEQEKDNNENNNNNYYQCLDGEEFVDVFEDHEEESKIDKEEVNLYKKENEFNVNFPPANYVVDIDEKKFQEFVKVSDKVLEENKEYLENLNNQELPVQIKTENIFDSNVSMKNESNKLINIENNINQSENTINNYDPNDFEFVSDKGKYCSCFINFNL